MVSNGRHCLLIKNDRFKLDGQYLKLWGIRTASAAINQKLTDHLIAQLDEYLAYQVNMVTVFFMGSINNSTDPFSKDGKIIDSAYCNRMLQILKACDQRKMVVIVGVFYQRVQDKKLQNWDACREAVRTTARWLKQTGQCNVIMNIANEQNSSSYKDTVFENIMNPANIIELCRLAHEEYPELIIGAGGYDHDKNEIIGRSEEVDVLLFDTDYHTDLSGDLYNRFVKAGIKNKPMINVEQFGGWTARFVPPGNYKDIDGWEKHLRDVDSVLDKPGLGTTFHSNPWCQGPSVGDYPSRYDLSGYGTKDSPGIRWYFEYVKKMSKLKY